MAKSLVCANELLTRGLIYPHVLIDMLYVTQKTLPYMPRGRNMAVSSALIYTSRKLVRCTGNLLNIIFKEKKLYIQLN